RAEAWVTITFVAIAAVPALLVMLALRRGIGQRWLGFVSSLVDCTLVTGELALFALLGYPHLAINSRVLFCVYFLVLAATTLRYDARICLVTGVTAMVQYLLLVLVIAHRGFAAAAPR